MAAIIARHYLDALDNGPDDADVGDLIALALEQLERAGRRAEGLGSPDEALRHYTTALARDARARRTGPGCCEGAARAARSHEPVGRGGRARRAGARRLRVDRAAGRRRPRWSRCIGEMLLDQGHVQAALELMASRLRPAARRAADADDAILAAGREPWRVPTPMRGDTDERAAVRGPGDGAGRGPRRTGSGWSRLLSRQAVNWLATGRPTGGDRAAAGRRRARPPGAPAPSHDHAAPQPQRVPQEPRPRRRAGRRPRGRRGDAAGRARSTSSARPR